MAGSRPPVVKETPLDVERRRTVVDDGKTPAAFVVVVVADVLVGELIGGGTAAQMAARSSGFVVFSRRFISVIFTLHSTDTRCSRSK